VNPYRLALALGGAAATAAIAFGAVFANGSNLVAETERRAQAARDMAGGEGVELSFTTRQGWLTRHPTLSGGAGLDDKTRARVAQAIADTPGVGGVTWQARGIRSRAFTARDDRPDATHCQSDVEAILRTRSIRFARSSAAIDPASLALLDEVVAALKPCVGSIIAVTGHTNKSGVEAANIILSRARADAVRRALISRGIPAEGLRTAGLGSAKPVEGLDPEDPANRRIDFSVIEKVRLIPTPIDTPGSG